MTSFGVRDLVVRYGRTTAVDGVSLNVAPGQVVALVGGDGAGKTSVLRALAGAVAPAGGRVIRPPEHHIGYVPTGSGVYTDLTARENLAFSGRAYGLRGARLTERIEALLVATGLSSAGDRRAGALSGGMRQKLALGAALLHEPELLVLDEPTTGIDPVSRGELWRSIARAAAGGAAITFSTTYVEEAERATYVIALHAGRVLVEGRPDDLVAAAGRVVEVPQRPEATVAYRRGARFRISDPSGRRDGVTVRADLQDAVTFAALGAFGARDAA